MMTSVLLPNVFEKQGHVNCENSQLQYYYDILGLCYLDIKKYN